MAPLAKYSKGYGVDCLAVTRRSIPVIANFEEEVPPPETVRLRSLAERLLANEPGLSASGGFGPGVASGIGEGPALLIGDHREVGQMGPEAAEYYEYRISALAGDRDLLLIGGNRNEAFERYRADTLGLGEVEVVLVPPASRDGRVPLAARCLASRGTLDHIARRAADASALTIVPHIGMGSAWVLATRLAKQAGVPVYVAAAASGLTRRVNDKVWFSSRVAEVLGPSARPAFRSVYGPAALAAHVSRLARQAGRIVVKIPDSAGSAGNIAIDSLVVRDLSLPGLRGYLLSILGELGWRVGFPLLVEVWDSLVVASPSVQMWVPHTKQGPPVVEGMFEQLISGTQGAFVGSVPASLPHPWARRLAEEALRIATLFQYLRCFGRYSFDAVIAGRDYDDAVLHWLECNGRWGGVSVPMTLANRLTGDWARGSFVVVQLSHMAFEKRTFSEALALLGDTLYRQGGAEGVVLLAPLAIERGYGVNLMAIAATINRAQILARQATERLTGTPA